MRYFLSYLALLPAAILCYLPVIHHVRVRKTLLILGGIPLLFFWAAIGGSLGTRFHVEFYQWLAPMLPIFALVFYFSSDLSTARLPMVEKHQYFPGRWRCIFHHRQSGSGS